MQSEVYLLKKLKSRHIPRLFGVFFDSKRIYIAQELAGKRHLKAFYHRYRTQITVAE